MCQRLPQRGDYVSISSKGSLLDANHWQASGIEWPGQEM
uniref:Uncharacterized protein n=1 Tax=Anguilla anguilla TaxID=7936 RepID=A0A0E9Q4K1_ANGAN